MKNYKKLIASAIGGVVLVLTTVLAVGPELIPLKWLPYIQVLVALLLSGSVHQARNVKNVPSLYPSDATNGAYVAYPDSHDGIH